MKGEAERQAGAAGKVVAFGRDGGRVAGGRAAGGCGWTSGWKSRPWRGKGRELQGVGGFEKGLCGVRNWSLAQEASG